MRFSAVHADQLEAFFHGLFLRPSAVQQNCNNVHKFFFYNYLDGSNFCYAIKSTNIA